jgi:hypothetical protein
MIVAGWCALAANFRSRISGERQRGIRMPNKLATFWLAVALVFAGAPVRAAGMPGTGTKNFVPGNDAPSYLTNANLGVAPGTPDQSPIGSAYNEPARPLPATEPAYRAETSRRAGFAGSQSHAGHASRSSSARRRPSRTARAGALKGRRFAAHGATTRAVRGWHRAAAHGRTAAAAHGRASNRRVAAKSAAGRG